MTNSLARARRVTLAGVLVFLACSPPSTPHLSPGASRDGGSRKDLAVSLPVRNASQRVAGHDARIALNRTLARAARGLHPKVVERLRSILTHLTRTTVATTLSLNSGRRAGSADDSMHNQGLAVDLAVTGLNTVAVAGLLRRAGFTCVTEYYDSSGRPCGMAHGDLRGTDLATGAYAPGGRKAMTCPRRAFSKTGACRNDRKEHWRYVFR